MKKRERKFQELLNKAKEYFKKGDFEKASFYFQETLKIGFRYGTKKEILTGVTNDLALALGSLGNFTEARKKLREAWRFCSKGETEEIIVILNFGISYYNEGRESKNKELFEEAIRYFKMAKEKLLIKRKKLEREEIKEIEEIKRDIFSYLHSSEFVLAQIYFFEEENPDKTIELLEGWLEKENNIDKPLLIQGLFILAEAYRQKSEEKSQLVWEKVEKIANSINFSLAEKRFYSARALILREKFEPAINEFKKGLAELFGQPKEISLKELAEQISSKKPKELTELRDIISHFAYALVERGRFEEGIEKILEINLKISEHFWHALTFYGLGRCQMALAERTKDLEEKKERYEKGIEYLQKAAQLGEEKAISLINEIKGRLARPIKEVPPKEISIEAEKEKVPSLEKKWIIPKEEKEKKSIEELGPEEIKPLISEIERKNKEFSKIDKILEEAFSQQKPALILEMIRKILPEFREKMAEMKKREFSAKEIWDLKQGLVKELMERKIESKEILNKLTGSEIQEYLEELEKRIKKL